ncbi:hypothetical protein F4810DRAFT_707602 [Camillea tinctor]|nr:hypothetical protein F4810DRAFT_707602 [Camillea tinctor]
MHFVTASLVTLLAAASIAAPISGDAISPLTSVMEEVGKQTPGTVHKATEAVGDKAAPAPMPSTMATPKNGTATAKPPANNKAAAGDPISGLLSGLTGGLGGGLL